MSSEPVIISGGNFTDPRGTLSFVNDFDLREVRRFYTIEHPDTRVIRAWQGHRKEQKWFYVAEGSFLCAWVRIDDWANPGDQLSANHVILSSRKSEILHLPGGFANGFRALSPQSKLIVFSDCSVEESAADNYRFDKDRWFQWNE